MDVKKIVSGITALLAGFTLAAVFLSFDKVNIIASLLSAVFSVLVLLQSFWLLKGEKDGR